MTCTGPDVIFDLANYPHLYNDVSDPSEYPDVVNLPDAYRFFCDECQFPATEW